MRTTKYPIVIAQTYSLVFLITLAFKHVHTISKTKNSSKKDIFSLHFVMLPIKCDRHSELMHAKGR